MKGIIWLGDRKKIPPLTANGTKGLLPVYDKPTVYYALSALMGANVREIAFVGEERELSRAYDLFSDGRAFGTFLSYAKRERGEGLLLSLAKGESFIGNEAVALMTADRLFFGKDLSAMLKRAEESAKLGKATAFVKREKSVRRLEDFSSEEGGMVVGIDDFFDISTGLWVFDSRSTFLAERLIENRGENCDISDLLGEYESLGVLRYRRLGKTIVYSEIETSERLLAFSNYIKNEQIRQGKILGCIEEVALKNGWIKKSDILARADDYGEEGYGKYLRKIAEK